MTDTTQSVAAWLHTYTLPAMVAVFVLTILSLYWPGRRDEVEKPGRIPLEDES